jgi:Domain of unknown function (DUF6875)
MKEESAMTKSIKTAGVVADRLTTCPFAGNANEFRSASPAERPVPAQTTNLFLLEDLEDANRTRGLPESDLRTLHAVADWINTFVARPHKDLGRPGTVCPFVPVALERKMIWLAPERIADCSTLDVVELVKSYKKQFLDLQPNNGGDTNYQSMVVVFTDLPGDRAKELFDGLLEHLGAPSYAEDGLVMGAFYDRNEGSAIYNANFRPFTPPVPFLLMRHAVISDWKFFLDNESWLALWARRYGEFAVQALAEELRRLPWRAPRN